MNALYSATIGNGPDLILLHGWGLHSGVWERFAPLLAQHYRVTRVDLPGFGRSPLLDSEYTLDAVTAQLSQQLPRNAVWIGWSLGGLFAAAAAATVPAVRGFVGLASTPKFVRSEDWPHATAADLLDEFSLALVQDYRNTVQRFLAIQAIGSERAREEIAWLKEIVFTHGEPSVAALEASLNILKNTDLRTRVAPLPCPSLLLYGQRDRLVPPQSGAQYQPILGAHAQVAVIKGAGHAPFLSHPDEVIAAMLPFLSTVCTDKTN